MKYLVLSMGGVCFALMAHAQPTGATIGGVPVQDKRPTQLTGVSTLASGTLSADLPSGLAPFDNVLLETNFASDAVGYLPEHWRTSSTAEVVSLDELPGHWLTLNQPGQLLAEGINHLPAEFTLQFDLVCTNPFNFYSTGFHTILAALPNPAQQFTQWTHTHAGDDGVAFMLHPMDVAGRRGHSELNVLNEHKRTLHAETPVRSFWANGRNLVRVLVWRQQERMRVYINDEKVWDIPHAFQPDKTYNSVIFAVSDTHRDGDSYYLSNFRLAGRR